MYSQVERKQNIKKDEKLTNGFVVPLFQTLRNANLEFTIAMQMATVPTLKGRSTVLVVRDTLEMESRVLVSNVMILSVRTCNWMF